MIKDKVKKKVKELNEKINRDTAIADAEEVIRHGRQRLLA